MFLMRPSLGRKKNEKDLKTTICLDADNVPCTSDLSQVVCDALKQDRTINSGVGRSVVVAQLEERSLPKLQIGSSNPSSKESRIFP